MMRPPSIPPSAPTSGPTPDRLLTLMWPSGATPCTPQTDVVWRRPPRRHARSRAPLGSSQRAVRRRHGPPYDAREPGERRRPVVRPADPQIDPDELDMVHHMTDPAAPISITAIDSGLRVAGEIDAHTAPLIADAIEASEHDRLVVDLAEVEFVDSSGLRVLIDAHQQRVGAGRSIVLANPSAVVRRLFEIAGVEGYLDITDEITDAPPA